MPSQRDEPRLRASLASLTAALAAVTLACGPAPAPAVQATPTTSSASAPTPAGALEFLAVGDWGRSGNKAQRQVADPRDRLRVSTGSTRRAGAFQRA